MGLKHDVCSVALELFAQKGYQATTMRQIAAELGLTVGALYHYEPTKEGILVKIMERGMRDLNDRATEALREAGDDPARQLAALVRVHVQIHGEQRSSSLVSDTEIRSLCDANKKTVLTRRAAYEQLWREVLERGHEQGMFRGNMTLTRLALLQMCTGVVYWYAEDKNLTLTEIADEFAALALQMAAGSVPNGVCDG